jgi:hypothetical protein
MQLRLNSMLCDGHGPAKEMVIVLKRHEEKRRNYFCGGDGGKWRMTYFGIVKRDTVVAGHSSQNSFLEYENPKETSAKKIYLESFH